MLLPAAILLVIVGLIVLLIWAIRKSKTIEGDTNDAMAALAHELGASYQTGGKAPLVGTLGGRAVSVIEGALVSRGESPDYYVKITVAVHTAVTLELHPQTSKLGAQMLGDVELGDPDFDKWYLVRTNNPDVVRRAIRSERRPQMVDWVRHGVIVRLWVRDGLLTCEGGQGLIRRSHIAQTRAVLDVLVEIAAGLE